MIKAKVNRRELMYICSYTDSTDDNKRKCLFENVCIKLTLLIIFILPLNKNVQKTYLKIQWIDKNVFVLENRNLTGGRLAKPFKGVWGQRPPGKYRHHLNGNALTRSSHFMGQ